MMIRNDKKGIEPVVGTILMLLITVAAVAIVFGVIIPYIQQHMNQSTGTASCINSQLNIDTQSGYTCFNETEGKIHVSVSRGPQEFDLYGIQFIVPIAGTTQQFLFKSNLPEKNAQSLFTLNVNITDNSSIKSVSIAPILRSGNTQETCTVVATAQLPRCV